MQQATHYYMREDAYFEPLVFKWYAWPYLIPPITAAMNLTGRGLRLMKSFLANHQLHIAASRDPTLVGGDFVNCREEQLEDVRALVKRIEVEHADYLEVRKALAEVQQLLEPMKGMTLEPLYASLPDVLRGYVELVYDQNHCASIRLIEGLLYEGDLYKPQEQSLALGVLDRQQERPFVLSSPRLADADHLHLHIPFADQFVDALFATRERPIRGDMLQALFAEKELSGGLSPDALFTTEPPSIRWTPLTEQLRISYLGHAGLMLETAKTTVLVDPVIATRSARHGSDVISFSELPERIDYVCLTHSHMDHVCLETLLQLRYKIGRILVPKNNGGSLFDPSLKLMLGKLGFDVWEMEDMERLDCVDGTIRALPFLGEHADLNIRSKTAWLFEFAGKRIFSGADSSSLDDRLYQRIAGLIGKVNLLFIGMECVGAPMSWLYGSLFTKPIPRQINESRRFNGSDCASVERMIEIFRPDATYVYALGMEPWFKYFMGVDYDDDARQIQESDRLLAICTQRGQSTERLFAKRVWNF
ncbi:MBL fold metallo-hydrolase [Xanthomonas sp. D-109]|uniref:MBL fold metallo-hydrolase n=1 Tax=Xanthomonas sp. D-109 TaxID=2821274 RepID=UPI001FD44EA6|nr:MBL fold metallo-hydrolase [Xanthomonas sp. D-109]